MDLSKIEAVLEKLKSGEADFSEAALAAGLRRPRIWAQDGFCVSVQASEFTYCEPRDNAGPYDKAEAGFPSQEVPCWADWAEEPDSPTQTVYGYMPVSLVAYAILAHGGRAMPPEGQPHLPVTMFGELSPDEDPAASEAGGAEILSRADSMAETLAQISSASIAWIRACALGTPAEEKAARFRILDGAGRSIEWESIAQRFLAIDPVIWGADQDKAIQALAVSAALDLHLDEAGSLKRKPCL